MNIPQSSEWAACKYDTENLEGRVVVGGAAGHRENLSVAVGDCYRYFDFDSD